MPSQFGWRLSSVVDVRMKEGNNKEQKISGGIGLIASRLTIEAPMKKDKSSFMTSLQALPSGVYTIRISEVVSQTNKNFIKN